MSILKMPLASRREVLSAIAVSASVPTVASRAGRISAIAFDAFALFSPTMIVRRAEEIFGDQAAAFVGSASAKLFAYTWLYTSAGRYSGLENLARDAFDAVATAMGRKLRSSELEHLVAGYWALEAWPDVPDALEALQRNGIRLEILSNLPRRALESSLVAGGLDRHFEHVLSTDEVGAFKPAPAAYRLAASRLGLRAPSIGFAASAGWDASGANWFGYPTVWVNRTMAQGEPAHTAPTIVSSGMDGVLSLARRRTPRPSTRNLWRPSTE